LLALIAEKGYDRVTVQDVLDRAKLSRATFYNHFRDKDDLLRSGLAGVWEALRGAMAAFARGENGPSCEDRAMTRTLFEHVAGRRRLYRGLVGIRTGAVVVGQARDEVVELVRERLAEVVAARRATPCVPVEVVAAHVVGTLLGILAWWL